MTRFWKAYLRNLVTFYADDGGGGGGVSGQHPGTGTGNEPGEGGNPAPGNPPAEGGDPPAEGLTGKAAEAIAAGGEGDPPPGDPAPDGRPANIPEQFWTAGVDGAEGSLNSEAMVKAWSDTRQENKDLKANTGDGKAPEKAEDYVFTPPTETKVLYENLKDDDEGMSAIAIAAQKAGLDQKQYQTLVETFFENCPDAIMAPFNEAEELAIIGKNGQAVIDENVRWLNGLIENGTISKQEYDEAMLMGATGYGVRFMAKMRQEATGEHGIPLPAVNQDGALPSKAELNAMVGDPKYGSDPAYTADVDKKFEQVYGTGDAGSSEQNMGISQMNTAPANIRRADELKKAQA